MYLKTILILVLLLLIVDVGLFSKRPIDGEYLLAFHGSALYLEKMKEKKDALDTIHVISDLSSRIAASHAELQEEFKKSAYTLSGKNSRGSLAAGLREKEAFSRINDLKGRITIESEAYDKALKRLEGFHQGLAPEASRQALKDPALMSAEERGKSSEEHLKKGIGYFQSEDLENAIKIWDAALELDPYNRTAAEYKKRAEAVLDRLKEIQGQGKRVKKDTPTLPPS